MSKYVDGIWLEIEICCNCDLPFAMAKDFRDRKLKDHTTFYCPRGHAQHYTGETEEQKLKQQLRQTEQRLSQTQQKLQQANENLTQVSTSYTRMRKRIANGVCPCCNRTFQNLLSHMKTEHPDFGNNQILKTLRETFGLSQPALGKEIGVQPAYISNYERRKPVPAHAAQAIEGWISKQG